MLGAITSFCLLAVGARELSDQLPTIEVLFLRSVIGTLLVAGIILASGNSGLFRTARLGLHTVLPPHSLLSAYCSGCGTATLRATDPSTSTTR